MEEREKKGIKVQRIPRKEHKNIKVPTKEAEPYEYEFIENIEDFGVSALEIGKDKYTVKLVAEVTVEKNGKHIKTYPLKVNKERIAREILAKLLGAK